MFKSYRLLSTVGKMCAVLTLVQPQRGPAGEPGRKSRGSENGSVGKVLAVEEPEFNSKNP